MLKVLRLTIRDVLLITRYLPVLGLTMVLTCVLILPVTGPAYSDLIGCMRVYGVEITYLEYLAIGLLLMVTLETSILTSSLCWIERRTRVLTQLIATLASRSEYFVAKLLSSTISSLILSLVLICISLPMVQRFSLLVCYF